MPRNLPCPSSQYPPYPAIASEAGTALDRLLRQCRFELVMAQAWSGVAGWRLGGRCEPTVLFFWLERGEVGYSLGRGGAEQRLRAGELLLVPERVPVEAWSTVPGRVPHLCGRLTARLLGSVDVVGLLGLAGAHPASPALAARMRGLAREAALKPVGWQRTADAAVAQLVIEAVRHRPSRTMPALDTGLLLRYQPVLQLLEGRFAEPELRVADLARAAHLSEVSLRKLCRRTMGMSPLAVLRQFRLERSCTLLRETDLPLKAIAERCGFSDASFFCRAFRRAIHLTPTAYRCSDGGLARSAPAGG